MSGSTADPSVEQVRETVAARLRRGRAATHRQPSGAARHAHRRAAPAHDPRDPRRPARARAELGVPQPRRARGGRASCTASSAPTSSRAGSWPRTSPATTTTSSARRAGGWKTSPRRRGSSARSPPPRPRSRARTGFRTQHHRLDLVGVCASLQLSRGCERARRAVSPMRGLLAPDSGIGLPAFNASRSALIWSVGDLAGGAAGDRAVGVRPARSRDRR